MDIDKAILSFSQSEKIKEGLIWSSQLLNILQGMTFEEKKGSEKIISTLINMIGSEIKLISKVSGDERWEGIESLTDKAVVMIESGVSQEASIHLSQALSKVTNIGQQSMMILKENDLL